MWLAPIPWADRTWALQVLTAQAPSERYYQQLGRTHKKLTDWARQMIVQLRRWLPHRTLVFVADSSYAVLDLLHFCQSMTRPVTFITRLSLDAALYEPAPPRLPGQMGRPRLKGQRLRTAKTTPRSTGNRVDCRTWSPGTTVPYVEWRSPLIRRSGLTSVGPQYLSVGS